MRSSVKFCLANLLALFLLTISLQLVSAGFGGLDTGFGTDGKVTTDFSAGQDEAYALVLQPNGKLVQAGTVFQSAGGFNFGLARYNADGTVDSSFGTGGKITTDFFGLSDAAHAVVVQPDGKIVAAGLGGENNINKFALARYNTDGTLDTAFGTGGKVTTDLPSTNARALALVRQSDGKLVAAGVAFQSIGGFNFALVRYNGDGSLDASFGEGGKVTTDFSNSVDGAEALVLQPDGKFVAAGLATQTSSGGQNFALARYLSNGTLDPSFGDGGKVTTNFSSEADERATALVLQPDGRLVAAGVTTVNTIPFGENFALARYNTDGTLDLSFGSDGRVTTDFSNDTDRAESLVLQPDGKLVAAGVATQFPLGGQNFALSRYNSDGTPDLSFGSGGKFTIDFFGLTDYAHAIVRQLDGRIVAGGITSFPSGSTGSSDFALARYDDAANPSSSPSPTPGCGSLSIVAQPLSQTIFLNQTATLSVSVSGVGPFTYQWYSGTRGDTTNPIAGAITNSFSPQATATVHRFNYWLRIRDACSNIVDSNTALVVTTDKRPLVFIPGIVGSRIRTSVGTPLWPIPALTLPNPCDGYNDLTLDPAKIQPAVVVPDVIRSIATGPDFPFQVAFPVYESLLNALKTNGYRETGDQTLFLLPYDWRKSNVTSSELLRNLIDDIRDEYPNVDVDIVVHSMGGLVAQRYVVDHASSHHINKIISIGTPWLGAPKAISVLETGQFLPANLCPGTMKALSEYFPGMHELIPASKYFDLSILPAFAESGWDLNENNQPSEQYDAALLSSMLDQRHSISKPGLTSSTFHGNPGQDDGRSAPSNISYYHIHGRLLGDNGQPIDSTIGQIIAKRSLRCDFVSCYIDHYFDLKWIAGDGTVPSTSATRRGRGQDLNEPRSSILPPYNLDHLSLARDGDVLNKVVELLAGSGLSTTSLRTQSATLEVSEQSEALFYLQILGSPSIMIADGSGNSSTMTSTSPGAEIQGVSSYVVGNNAYILTLTKRRAYTITIQAENEPLAINLTDGTGEITSRAIRYKDLVLPPNTTLKLEFTAEGPQPLRFDRTGAGTFNEVITPTVSITGAAAEDTEAPMVQITSSVQGAQRLITVTSTDEDSGIEDTLFSLNGKDFQRYTGPFLVNPFQAPVIYAFADDHVGNRSGLIDHRLVKMGVPVLIVDATTNRGIALDSLLRSPEPFRLTYDHLWGTDNSTRIMLFALNFELAPNETASAVTVTAQDGSSHLHNLPVEYVGRVPGADWLTCIIVKMNQDVGDAGDVSVTLTVHGASSNSVKIGIGHIGGGPTTLP